MVTPVPQPQGSSGGSNSPVLRLINPNPDVANPQWWDYLNLEDEDAYNRKMNILQVLKSKNNSDINIYYLDDESSSFFGYSYEEIISMADNGVFVPDEILNWAMNMAQSNPTTESIPVKSDDAEALYTSLKQNANVNLKTISEIFTKKCEENRIDILNYKEELSTLHNDISVLKNEIEIIKENAEKKIEPLKEEWNNLRHKLANGIPLTEAEKERALYLKGKFEEINENLRAQIYSKIININLYIDKINEVNKKIEIAGSFTRVSKTILDELNDPENSKTASSILSNYNYDSSNNFSNDNITSNFTTVLYDSVNNLDTSVTDVNNQALSIQGIMEEMSEIGGFKLDDPNHNITLSLTDDLDLFELERLEISDNENDNEDEENTDNNIEEEIPEFEDVILEVPVEDTLEPEFAYNPEGAKDFERKNNDYVSPKPLIKAPEGTYNQSGNNGNKRR